MFELRPLETKQIVELYNERMVEDFPDEELKPLFLIKKHIEDNLYECFGLFKDNFCYAYAYCVRVDSPKGYLYLIDYLAVHKDYRNKGLGSILLNLLRETLKNKAYCVIVEIENPDMAEDENLKAEAIKRENYYKRNNIIDTGATELLFYVEYKLLDMVFDGKSVRSREEMFELIDVIYRKVIPPEIYNKFLNYHK